MSLDGPLRTASLVATAGPGVAIRLFDGQNHEVAKGVGRLEYDGPEGLYSIEWVSAGTVRQTFASVTAVNSPLTVSFQTEDSQAVSASQAWPQPQSVSIAEPSLSLAERGHGSSVAVILTARGADPVTPAMKNLRLIHRTRGLMRASRTMSPWLKVERSETCRCFRIRPGRYHLQFHAVTGEMLNVSVPALVGRQTIIFLQAAQADLLVPDGDGFARVEGHGIDAARSVMISVAGDEEEDRVRERLRLAGVLLHDLAAGTGSLSQDFLSVLADDRTDPLLKLYGALVTLSCLERSRSPALDEIWPADGPDGAFRARWAEAAAKWLSAATAIGMPPDIVAASWHLQKAEPGVAGMLGSDVAKRMEVPPMLECAWRWVIAHSLDDPLSVPSSVNLLAASRSAGGTTPWLCWNADAATAAPAKSRAGGASISELAGDVARKTTALLATRGPEEASPLDTLSADVGTTALRVAQVAGNSAATSDERLPTDLALALSLPSQSLKRRLARTSDALDRALDRRRQDGNHQTGRLATAPALSRPVTVADDPQKGRFGRRSSRGGFALRATFNSRSKTWTRIELIVTGDAPDGTLVQFYLHDSFKPVKEEAKFRDGRAQITVTSYGGFTVGAWIGSRAVELELDLSKIRGAPLIIRTQ